MPLPCFVNIILYALFSFVWVTDQSFLYDPNKLIFVYATVCWWICQSCLIDTQIVFVAFLIFKALNTTESQRTIFILSLFLDEHTFYRICFIRIKKIIHSSCFRRNIHRYFFCDVLWFIFIRASCQPQYGNKGYQQRS